MSLDPMNITKEQKKQLKSMAHHLKPVIMIGQNGLTTAVCEEIDRALDQHELIKVKIAADKKARLIIIDEIVDKTASLPIHKIGQMGIFFRRNTKDPKVILV